MAVTPPSKASASDHPHLAPLHSRPFYWWVMRLLPVGLFFVAGVLLIFVIGLAQKAGWLQPDGGSAGLSQASDGEQVFTCPMHPQIRQPVPGRCPICGMELVKAAAVGANIDEFAVNIDPAQRRLANIQTAEVKQEPVSTSIETIGAIQIDESRQATIAAYIDGRLERLFADYTGVEVNQGDHLAVLYSPQLFAAQVEYVESGKALEKMTGGALASVRQVQEKLVENSRQKLIELGMTEEQVKQLETSGKPQSRLTIYAPIGGTVTQKLAEEGKYIKAGEPIYRIANLTTVWLMLELYPEDASRIRFGQRVQAELQSLPGQKLEGRVAFIDPTVNVAKRTVGVRVEFKNDEGRLRPGDYARAVITIPIGPQGEIYDSELAGKWISPMHPQVIRDQPGDCPICGMKLVPTSRFGYTDAPVTQPDSLYVPRSAVLMAGEHSVVYIETEPGRFELRKVALGPILRDKAVILSGVEVGEQVATSGNFLIDSQMQLAGKPSLIDPTRYTPKKGTEQSDNHPLSFASIHVQRIPDEMGDKLEQLYRAYFAIQKSFANDNQPSAELATQLHQLAAEVAEAEEISKPARKQLQEVAADSEHLHHLSLEKGRKKFKAISAVMVTLATTYRGAKSTEPFRHFFCPMVPGGAGDWLQADDKLINPYFGSQMLTCGELVHTIAADATEASDDKAAGDNPNHTTHKHEGE
ncbi:Cation efflux system protein CusB precursor [Symmachiella dynata]|uniref:Cation efflux system protein CusB n=2 Tax=Symmachiella dynata TaxID=2527995 RepID=A0A517ZPT6_9PLAN|nr:Cation efflux system protein CusB precursor [Symmachiella dynata]